MFQPGDCVWLRTTAGEMLATVIDPEVQPGDLVVYLIEVDGGPRMLAMEDGLRAAEPRVVEA